MPKKMRRRSSAVFTSVLLGASALVLASCSAGPKNVSEATGTNNASDATTENAEAPTSKSRKPPATRPTPKGAAVDLVEVGFSTYADYDGTTRATAAAVLKNTGDADAVFFKVVYSFKDADGKPVATETDYVDALDAGGTGYSVVEYVDLKGDPVTVDAAVLVDAAPWMEGYVVPVVVEGVMPEDYGDGSTVNGTATNDTDDVIEMAEVSCVLRSEGKIVGGATGYMDALVPGGAIAWDASGPVPADAAECFASTT